MDPVPAESAIEEASAPTLPYSGYGSVAILDDGMVLITLGGEFRIDPAKEDSAGRPEFVVTPGCTIGYQMGTTGLALVQYKDDEVFLDKDGTELARRGLGPDQVVRTTFRHSNVAAQGANRFALVSLNGDLNANIDRADGELAVTVTDRETGRTLRFTGVITDGGSKALPDSDPRISLLEPPVLEPSNREIACAQGSCTITCEQRGCAAYCDTSGEPVCRCITHL